MIVEYLFPLLNAQMELCGLRRQNPYLSCVEFWTLRFLAVINAVFNLEDYYIVLELEQFNKEKQQIQEY